MKTALSLAVLLSAALAASARAAAVSDDKSGNDLLCMSWGCVGGAAFGQYSSWHGNADGDWSSNDGPTAGLELAAPIPGLQDWGFGVQGAASEGWSNLEGKGSTGNEVVQRQTFLSYGVFRRPNADGAWWDRFGAGIVEDVALNHGFGTESDAFTLRQVRGKASYAVYGGSEVGVWFARHGRTQFVSDGNDIYRAADQFNFFYQYSFANGGHIAAYWGPGRAVNLAASQSFQPTNSPYIFNHTYGADAVAPFNDYLQAYGGFAYASPRLRNRMGDEGQIRRTYNVQGGVRVLWGGNAHARENTGRHFMPYLPATDNGNFMTTSNLDN